VKGKFSALGAHETPIGLARMDAVIRQQVIEDADIPERKNLFHNFCVILLTNRKILLDFWERNRYTILT
jgi:hypothetical protein